MGYMRPLFDRVGAIAASRIRGSRARSLRAAGVDDDRIRRWVRDGRLYRVHRGVYAIGRPAPSVRGDYMGALLACGEGAVLSHHACGQLTRIRPGTGARPELTVPTTAGRAQPGIIVHRVPELHVLDTADFDGIPITTVPRTLLDLAPALSLADLARACHEAWVRHGTTPAHILACIERNPRKHGARRLRQALGSDVTPSVLEDGFLALLREHGLPLPRTNIDRGELSLLLYVE